jgi:pSer/pThr/pTyr-binding forkhead associated (FHA) protein
LFLVGQQVIRFEIVREAEEGLGPAVEQGTLLFGTPTTRLYARLSQRSIEGITRDVYYLGKRETVLGRESGDIVFTEDPFLSRRHAAIRATAPSPTPSPTPSRAGAGGDSGTFALVDLGSSNGSYIQIRTEVPLQDGDQFRIGQQLFRVDLTRNAGATGA